MKKNNFNLNKKGAILWLFISIFGIGSIVLILLGIKSTIPTSPGFSQLDLLNNQIDQQLKVIEIDSNARSSLQQAEDKFLRKGLGFSHSCGNYFNSPIICDSSNQNFKDSDKTLSENFINQIEVELSKISLIDYEIKQIGNFLYFSPLNLLSSSPKKSEATTYIEINEEEKPKTTSEIAAPAESILQQEKRKTLVIGDSITADKIYADTLSKLIINRQFDVHAEVGKQTSWMKEQYDNFKDKGYDEIIILGGINDIASGIKMENIQKNLEYIYSDAKKKNLRVIALTLTPNKPHIDKINQLNNWIKQQSNIIAVDIYFLLADNDKLKDEYDAGDGLHPNIAGKKVIAQKIYETAYINIGKLTSADKKEIKKDSQPAAKFSSLREGSFSYLKCDVENNQDLLLPKTQTPSNYYRCEQNLREAFLNAGYQKEDLFFLYALAYKESSCKTADQMLETANTFEKRKAALAGTLQALSECRICQGGSCTRKCQSVSDEINAGIKHITSDTETVNKAVKKRQLELSPQDLQSLTLFSYYQGPLAASFALDRIKQDIEVKQAMVDACKYFWTTIRPNSDPPKKDRPTLDSSCNSEGLGAGYPEAVLKHYKKICEYAGGQTEVTFEEEKPTTTNSLFEIATYPFIKIEFTELNTAFKNLLQKIIKLNNDCRNKANIENCVKEKLGSEKAEEKINFDGELKFAYCPEEKNLNKNIAALYYLSSIIDQTFNSVNDNCQSNLKDKFTEYGDVDFVIKKDQKQGIIIDLKEVSSSAASGSEGQLDFISDDDFNPISLNNINFKIFDNAQTNLLALKIKDGKLINLNNGNEIISLYNKDGFLMFAEDNGKDNINLLQCRTAERKRQFCLIQNNKRVNFASDFKPDRPPAVENLKVDDEKGKSKFVSVSFDIPITKDFDKISIYWTRLFSSFVFNENINEIDKKVQKTCDGQDQVCKIEFTFQELQVYKTENKYVIPITLERDAEYLFSAVIVGKDGKRLDNSEEYKLPIVKGTSIAIEDEK